MFQKFQSKMAQQQTVINGTVVIWPAEVQPQVRIFVGYNCDRCGYMFEIYCNAKAPYYKRFLISGGSGDSKHGGCGSFLREGQQH